MQVSASIPKASDQSAIHKAHISSVDLSPISILWARILAWYRSSLLRLLCIEIGSLYQSIQWSLRLRRVKLHRGDAKTSAWMAGAAYLEFGIETSAGTRYMQRIESEHPCLTLFEKLLLQRAWKAGWETCAHLGMLLDESQRYSLLPLGICEGILSYKIPPDLQIELDMLKRQWYKSQYELLDSRNPRQSG
jgi:hypothetical protein